MWLPWIDLLRLHGHIIEPRLPRKTTTFPPAARQCKPDAKAACATFAKQTVTSLRLCLGIGDGLLRSQ